MSFKPFIWKKSHLRVLDQRLLPQKIKFIPCYTVHDIVKVIRDMAVRGAPAIGCVAAYGMVLAAKRNNNLKKAAILLKNARPTAVNLAWAVDRMLSVGASRWLAQPKQLEKEAIQIDNHHHGDPLTGM